MKKYVRNIIFIACLSIFALVIVISIGDLSTILKTLAKTNFIYVLAGMGVLLIYLVLFPISLHMIARSKKCQIHFLDSFCVGATEFFFNNITPFSTGGQPLQVYCYNAKGVKPRESTSVLLINFMIYQIALNMFSIYALIRYYGTISNAIDNLPILILLGFSINLLMLLFIILLATTKRACVIIKKFLVLLCKIKFIGKFLTPKLPAFDEYAVHVQASFKEMIRDFKTLIISLVLKLVGLAAFYSVPFFCFKAIGVDLDMSYIFYITAMTSFVLTMVIWFPSPGSSGATEMAFAALFVILPGVDESISASGMIIWRFLTYYFVMIYGLVMYLVFEKRRKKDENRNIY